MLIDFEAEHRRIFLRSDPNAFLNTDHNTSAVHISTEQVFANAGLGIAIAAKDILDGMQKVKGASCYLKLTFSRREGGAYLLHNDPLRVTLWLNSGDARQLYTWLIGGTDSFDAEIGSPQFGLKRLSGRAEPACDDLMLVGENRPRDNDQRHSRIAVSLNLEAQLKLRAYCIGFIRLLYPSLQDQAAADLLTLRSVLAQRYPGHQRRDTGVIAPAMPVAANIPARTPPSEEAVPQPRQAGRPVEEMRKAIFAIGKRKWPAARIDVIKHIQESLDGPSMQLLIDQANAGDFSKWDGFAHLLDASRGAQ